MATPKKTSAKKKPATTAKAASAKKSTATKTVASKKTAPKKKSAPTAQQQAAELRSFRVSKQTQPFMTFKATRETLYWLVLGVVIILFTVWIMKLQNDISYIYDQIEVSAAASESTEAQLLLQETKEK